MTVLILCGGLGTRLRSMFAGVPKPMVPVNGKPFLEYQIEKLSLQGFNELILCVSYLSVQIVDYFSDGSQWGVTIQYAFEEQRLGTAGAIKNAEKMIDSTFLVLNGDSYLKVDLTKMLKAHRGFKSVSGALGTIATVRVANASRYGTVEVDTSMRILSFKEKAMNGSGDINAGVYIFEPNILDRIPLGEPTSLEQTVLLSLVGRLYAYKVDDYFVDIGTPEGLDDFENFATQL